MLELLATVTILLLSFGRTYPQMLAGAALEGLYYGLYASIGIGISFLQSFSGDAGHRALAGPATGLIEQAYDIQAVIRLA